MTRPDPDNLAAAPARPIPAALMLLFGAFLCLQFGQRDRWTWQQLLPFAIAITLCLVPPIRAGIADAMERIRRPSSRATMITVLAITAAAFALLFVPSLLDGNAYYPRSHDEQFVMLLTRFLADGKLWMPSHELADFFDSFYVIVRPVYASGYFSGASLLLVPALWLDLPHQLLPAIYSAVAVGLLYRVLTELFDGVAGVMGVVLLLASPMFRLLSVTTISHNLTIMLVLAATWAWLRWLGRPHWKWALLAGLFAGWAAITRPLEALCYIVPMALAALPAWRRLPMRPRLSALGVAVAAALPLFALQMTINRGVTGHLTQTPYQMYLDLDQPQTGYGFYHNDADVRPASPLVQKHLYYETFLRPSIQKHRPENVVRTFLGERLPLVFSVVLPHPLLLVILPVGLLALTDRRRFAFAAILPTLAVMYTPFPFLLSHYLVIWAPPLIAILVASEPALQRSCPRARTFVAAVIPLLFIAAAISGQAPLNPHATPRWPTPMMDDVHRQLAHLDRLPAVVLFRYDPRTTYNEEPVYNLEHADIDASKIIRAHDLGPERNREIAAYYAKRQPERFFYLYDIATRTLQPLGTAGQYLQSLGGRAMSRERLKLAIIAAVAVTMIALTIAHVHGINGPWYWTWPWRRLSFWIYPLVLVAAIPFFIAQRIFSPARIRMSLALLMLTTLLLQFATIAMQPLGLRRIAAVIENVGNTGYYTAAKVLTEQMDRGASYRDWLEIYPQLMPDLMHHAGYKPPGLTLFYIALIRIFGPGDAAATAGGIIIALLAAGGVAGTFYLIRAFNAGDEAAFRGASYFAIIPSLIAFFPQADQAYPLLAIVLMLLWVNALRTGRRWLAAAFGAWLTLLWMLSPTFLMLGVFLGVYTLMHIRDRGRKGMLRALEQSMWAVVTIVALFTIGWIIFGFDPIQTFIVAAKKSQEHMIELARPWPLHSFLDLVDIAMGTGWISYPLAAMGAVAAWRMSRAQTGDTPWRLTVLALLQIFLAVAVALLPGENARLMLMMMPLLMAPIGIELARWSLPARTIVFVLLLITIAAIVQNMITLYMGPDVDMVTVSLKP